MEIRGGMFPFASSPGSQIGANRLTQKYFGMEFLGSMVRDMTRPNPLDRPSVGSVITRFTRLQSNVIPNQLKRALSPKASSDPLRDHLRPVGIAQDVLGPDTDPIDIDEVLLDEKDDELVSSSAQDSRFSEEDRSTILSNRYRLGPPRSLLVLVLQHHTLCQ